jgi:type II secretory pathway component PulC
MTTRISQGLLRGDWIVLLELALVVALAVTLAHWTWIALAPPTIASSQRMLMPDAAPAGAAAKRHLFGSADAAPAAPARAGAPARNLLLIGVLAPNSPDRGSAIFRIDGGKPRTVAAGDSISPGVVLSEVHPDHVVVTRNGASERVVLVRREARGNASR